MIAVDTKSAGQRNIPVHIYPCRMDSSGMERLRGIAGDSPELLRFWENLKQGYDVFESQHSLPIIGIGRTGQYLFSGIWQEVEEGLDIGEFASPQRSRYGDFRITIVKVDPGRYSLKLMSASEFGER